MEDKGMEKSSAVTNQRTYISKGIIPGVIIGGLLGILVGFLHRTSILIIPALSTTFSTIPFHEIIAGILFGIIIGGLIGGILALFSQKNINNEYVPETSTPRQRVYDDSNNVTFQIKEEQLNIAKQLMQTGEVKIYRETFSEEKNFTVPVEREDLVIEKIALASATLEHKDVPPEIIRIPLNEEQVEFTKRKVALENVSIYKQHIKDIKHIEAILKKEKSKVKMSGTPKIRDKSNPKQS